MMQGGSRLEVLIQVGDDSRLWIPGYVLTLPKVLSPCSPSHQNTEGSLWFRGFAIKALLLGAGTAVYRSPLGLLMCRPRHGRRD